MKMEIEEDHDLLVITSMKDEPEMRNMAFTAFCNRYQDFLWDVVLKVCRKHSNWYELSRAVYSNTIINVFEYAGSFSIDPKSDAKLIRTKIENWLISIANREFKNLASGSKDPIDPSELYDTFKDEKAVMKIENFMEEELDDITFSEEIVSKALALLPKERDKHILMVYFQYYEKGKGDQAKNLDPKVRKELALKYNTTEVNIRQINSRSKKIVIDFLKSNYNSKAQ
jgi:DNA-directed RNA polymerase specialized sigma24 family protein